MGAPLPTGSSLSALPVAPTIGDPRLYVPDVQQTQAVVEGALAIGQKLARLNDLKQQIELERAQRKAADAQAKAQETEADLMHGQLAQKFALAQQQIENQTAAEKINAAKIGALADVTVGPNGIAATDADSARLASVTGNTQATTSSLLAKGVQNATVGALSSLTPGATPAPEPSGVDPKDYKASDGTLLDAAYIPKAPNLLEDTIAKGRRVLLLQGHPIVTDEEVKKNLGINTQKVVYQDPNSNRKYETNVTYGPDQTVLAATPPVLTDSSTAEKGTQGQAVNAGNLVALQTQIAAARAAVKAWVAAGAPSKFSGMAANAANADTTTGGVLSQAIKSGTKSVVQAAMDQRTMAISSQLSALEGTLSSTLRGTEIGDLAKSAPKASDLGDPTAVLTKLDTLDATLSNQINTLKSGAGVKVVQPKVAPKAGEIRVNPGTGVKYQFDSGSNQWLPIG